MLEKNEKKSQGKGIRKKIINRLTVFTFLKVGEDLMFIFLV